MMVDDIKIRAFGFRDLALLAEMVAKQWDLGHTQSGTSRKVCGLLYALEIAASGYELFTAVKNGVVVGFAGYDIGKYGKWRQKVYFLLYKVLFYSPFILKRSAVQAYYDHYDYMPEEEKIAANCELCILIVDEKLRCCHLGEKLFRHTLGAALKSGYKKMLIAADGSCSLGFYEKIGCRRSVTFLRDDGFREPASDDGKCYVYEIPCEAQILSRSA